MSQSTISYKRDVPLTAVQFAAILDASSLGERRPTDNLQVMQQMLDHANLTITAWENDELIGVSRTLTDFGFVAYLSDLAVAKSHQRLGIGKRLIAETQAALSPGCMIVLLSAPAANEFYPRIGLTHNPRAWTLMRDDKLT